MDDQGPIRVYGWNWGRDEDRRPQVPWIGVFLLILGGLLVLERFPQYRNLGDVVVLAAGLAFLVVWLIRRTTFALYAGAILTAAMMLEHLGFNKEAAKIDTAVVEAVKHKRITQDIGGNLGTKESGAWIAQRVAKS